MLSSLGLHLLTLPTVTSSQKTYFSARYLSYLLRILIQSSLEMRIRSKRANSSRVSVLVASGRSRSQILVFPRSSGTTKP